MKKIALIFVIVCFVSCSSEDTLGEQRILTGAFKEFAPVENRITANVSTQNLSYSIETTGSGTTFTIKLLSNSRLELSCNECDETAPQIVPYRIINSDTFEIGSFLFTPETELITFKRI